MHVIIVFAICYAAPKWLKQHITSGIFLNAIFGFGLDLLLLSK